MRLPAPATERDRGAVIPLVALVLVVLITMCAIAVDLGRLMVTRRDLQADADVMSLDLVRHVDGRTRTQIENNSTPSWATLIGYTAQRNNISTSNVVVDLGTVDSTTRVYTTVGPSGIPNAVKVTTNGSINYFFKPGGGTSTRSAVASVTASACYDIGSYAVALSTQNTVLGSLLSPLLGGNLTLIGYQGLANANLTLAQLLAAQTSAGTVNQLLSQSVTMNQLQVMYVQALNNSGQTAAATILNGQVLGAYGSRTVTLGQVIGVSQGTGGSAATTQFNVLNMLAGAAFLANGTNFLSIPNLGLTVPGLVSAGLTNFKLIQGPEGDCYPRSVTTSQASIPLSLDITVRPCSLVSAFPLIGGVLGALTCILNPNQTSVAHVDLSFDIAQSAASITSIQCSLTSKSATVTVNSSLIVPHAKVTLLGLTLMDSSLAQSTPVGGAVSFAYPPDAGPATTKATGSGSLGFNTLSLGGALGVALDPVLQPVLSALQPTLFGPLGQAVGVRIAGADVTLKTLDCTAPKLVG